MWENKDQNNCEYGQFLRSVLGKEKFESQAKTILLNNDVFQNNVDVIILITCLKLKFLLKSKDMLHQVSIDLGGVNSFYSSFSDASEKTPLPFKSSKKAAW